jgi:hypothetical protein
MSTVVGRERLPPDQVSPPADSHRENPLLTVSQFLAYAAAFTSSWNGVRLEGINLTDYLIVAAAVLTLVVVVGNRRRLPVYSWAVLPPGALFLIALVGSAARSDPLLARGVAGEWRIGDAIGSGYGTAPLALVLRLAISLTAVTIIVIGLCDNVPNGVLFIKRVTYSWAFGSAVSAAYTVGEQFFPALGDFPFLYRIISSSRYTGLSNHPNHVGQAIVIALPLLIFFLASTRGWLSKLVATMILLVSVYAIIPTGSRAALIGGPAIIGATAIYLMISNKRIPAWALIAAPFSLAPAMVLLPSIVEKSRFFDESGVASNTGRFADLQQAVEDITANPVFGLAVGAPAPTMVPLAILVYGGLFYFFIFYGSLIYPLLPRPRSHDRSFTAILAISAYGVLLYGLLGNSWTDRYLYWPFAAIFAATLYYRRLSAEAIPPAIVAGSTPETRMARGGMDRPSAATAEEHIRA